MRKMKLLLCLSVVVLMGLGEAAELYEGDICDNKGKEGICTQTHDCKEAELQISQNKRHNFDRCGFVGLTEVVCCPTIDLRGASAYQSARKSVKACDDYYKNYIPENIPQIFHGVDSYPGEFPYMAALGLYSEDKKDYVFECGGTLISPRYILTAAHCTKDRSGRVVKIVRLGTIYVPEGVMFKDPLKDYDVKNVIEHPDYSRKKNLHDIALLELAEEVSFDKYVRPACLHATGGIPHKFLIMGWGYINEDDKRKNIMQKAAVGLIEMKTCNQTFIKTHSQPLSDFHLCAVDDNSDTCRGDSGGPLMKFDSALPVIVGITAFGGKTCSASIKRPTAYTKVQMYLEWIEKNVWPDTKSRR